MKVMSALRLSAFLRATLRAFSEISEAVTLARGSSFLMVMAMQPEPVPTSNREKSGGSLGLGALMPGKNGLPARDKTVSAICSVSGRGMRVSLVTKKSRP